jgi:hypothetical protein
MFGVAHSVDKGGMVHAQDCVLLSVQIINPQVVIRLQYTHV